MYWATAKCWSIRSAGKVTVSPVRKAGMTPFVTRIIEY
ncbi:hypothetical protein I551_2411 [Mycobacterium ulcerans str. Harvey]|uniref:Uncharacterized protein n=1 Tax=Mycobacterium ulcerans str. Harvey TaxID=1299332 RepID=A0ABP3AIP8_MYCUL|nr:hypothetical protein I551_2411 [Mycobacterium ulcerans str. Harvey]